MKAKLKGMKKKSKKIIAAVLIGVILVIAIWYFVKSPVQQTGYDEFSTCYGYVDKSCREVDCSLMGVSLYRSLYECELAYPSGINTWYRFENNQCTPISLYSYQITGEDWKSMAVCLEYKSSLGISDEPSDGALQGIKDYKILLIIIGIIVVIAIALALTARKGKNDDSE